MDFTVLYAQLLACINQPLNGNLLVDNSTLKNIFASESTGRVPSHSPQKNCRLVEIRAAQRTFEGAYIRTALGQFTFALAILKIFSTEFYSIGVVYAIYGVSLLVVGLYRRHDSNRHIFQAGNQDNQQDNVFRTGGNAVIYLTGVSIITYISLIILTMRLSD
ncbi:hypothetical protein HI914_01882 [Erysiphe necator]|nr:hypothetical protein HI914_01882 [Erysiphe necator]